MAHAVQTEQTAGAARPAISPGELPVRKAALFLPSLVGGGAERVFLTLAEGFLNRGMAVDLVVAGLYGELVGEVDPRARVVNLGKSHVLPALPGLAAYLKKEQPPVTISALTHTNLAAVWARRLAGSRTRLILSEHLTLKAHATLKQRLLYPMVSLFYPAADAVVAVSNGVARDLHQLLPRRTKVEVVYNPVNVAKVQAQAQAELEHPWLLEKECPVFLAVGRLHPNKDYPTLLRAFARLRSQLPCRLIILGRGEERSRLEAEIAALGLGRDVSLPGFTLNPFAYMRGADVFVLSSVFEGLANVLVEALACGATVVSTDCPSGPAEILANGEYGRLIAPGRPDLLAEAMLQALNERQDPWKAQQRAAFFDAAQVSQRYFDLIRGVIEGGHAQ